MLNHTDAVVAVVYNRETGDILRTVSGPTLESCEQQADPANGFDLMLAWDGVNDETHHVDLATMRIMLSARLYPILRVSGLTATITQVPAGAKAKVMWHDAEGEADDEGLELVFQKPGTYEILLTKNPEYRPETMMVTVQ